MKLVDFDTKDNMDAAIKAGTHDKPKVKGTDIKTPKSSDLFKGDYEKERGGTIDDTGNSAKEIINGIKNIGYSSMVTLYRKNRNGKLVQDVQFTTREDITPEIIKTTADKYGIDLNLISKLGADTQIKNSDGRKKSISELIAGLILSDLEAKQYAPDGIAADDYYYKTYSNSANKEANAIKKGIDPNVIQKQADKKADKAESDKTALYNLYLMIEGGSQLNHGIGFYDNNQLNIHIGFQENRAVFFNSNILHSPLVDSKIWRTTLTYFIHQGFFK